MLEARIIAPCGTLYYAGDATPYDLETLRQHLREYQREGQGEVAMDLALDDGPGRPIVDIWLGAMTDAGYHIRVCPHLDRNASS